MELGLDDLECTSEALRAWSPLRHLDHFGSIPETGQEI